MLKASESINEQINSMLMEAPTLGYIYIVRRDGTHGSAFPIDFQQVVIGRSEDADIRIQLGGVSPIHTKLIFKEETDSQGNTSSWCYIENHGETGTHILRFNSGDLDEESRVSLVGSGERTRLMNDDTFTVGERSFIFKYADKENMPSCTPIVSDNSEIPVLDDPDITASPSLLRRSSIGSNLSTVASRRASLKLNSSPAKSSGSPRALTPQNQVESVSRLRSSQKRLSRASSVQKFSTSKRLRSSPNSANNSPLLRKGENSEKSVPSSKGSTGSGNASRRSSRRNSPCVKKSSPTLQAVRKPSPRNEAFTPDGTRKPDMPIQISQEVPQEASRSSPRGVPLLAPKTQSNFKSASGSVSTPSKLRTEITNVGDSSEIVHSEESLPANHSTENNSHLIVDGHVQNSLFKSDNQELNEQPSTSEKETFPINNRNPIVEGTAVGNDAPSSIEKDSDLLNESFPSSPYLLQPLHDRSQRNSVASINQENMLSELERYGKANDSAAEKIVANQTLDKDDGRSITPIPNTDTAPSSESLLFSPRKTPKSSDKKKPASLPSSENGIALSNGEASNTILSSSGKLQEEPKSDHTFVGMSSLFSPRKKSARKSQSVGSRRASVSVRKTDASPVQSLNSLSNDNSRRVSVHNGNASFMSRIMTETGNSDNENEQVPRPNESRRISTVSVGNLFDEEGHDTNLSSVLKPQSRRQSRLSAVSASIFEELENDNEAFDAGKGGLSGTGVSHHALEALEEMSVDQAELSPLKSKSPKLSSFAGDDASQKSDISGGNVLADDNLSNGSSKRSVSRILDFNDDDDVSEKHTETSVAEDIQDLDHAPSGQTEGVGAENQDLQQHNHVKAGEQDTIANDVDNENTRPMPSEKFELKPSSILGRRQSTVNSLIKSDVSIDQKSRRARRQTAAAIRYAQKTPRDNVKDPLLPMEELAKHPPALHNLDSKIQSLLTDSQVKKLSPLLTPKKHSEKSHSQPNEESTIKSQKTPPRSNLERANRLERKAPATTQPRRTKTILHSPEVRRKLVFLMESCSDQKSESGNDTPRKSVSFGPKLSPELFDRSRPSSQPIKRGTPTKGVARLNQLVLPALKSNLSCSSFVAAATTNVVEKKGGQSPNTCIEDVNDEPCVKNEIENEVKEMIEDMPDKNPFEENPADDLMPNPNSHDEDQTESPEHNVKESGNGDIDDQVKVAETSPKPTKRSTRAKSTRKAAQKSEAPLEEEPVEEPKKRSTRSRSAKKTDEKAEAETKPKTRSTRSKTTAQKSSELKSDVEEKTSKRSNKTRRLAKDKIEEAVAEEQVKTKSTRSAATTKSKAPKKPVSTSNTSEDPEVKKKTTKASKAAPKGSKSGSKTKKTSTTASTTTKATKSKKSKSSKNFSDDDDALKKTRKTKTSVKKSTTASKSKSSSTSKKVLKTEKASGSGKTKFTRAKK